MSTSDAAALEAALGYARNGWALVPLWWLDAASNCACGKPNDAPKHRPGKHPIGRPDAAPHGVKDATTDEATIRRWVTRYPRMNLAIACGGVSGGLVGIDVDPKNGGDDTLAALEARYGPLPKTITNLTGGGGAHYLVHADDAVRAALRGTLGSGIDVKSDGGYLVVPPSRHESGRQYAWDAAAHPDDTLMAELPVWVVEASQAAVRSSTPNTNGASVLANHVWQASVIGTLIKRGLPAEIAATIVAKAVVELEPNHGDGRPYTEEEAYALAEELYGRYSPDDKASVPRPRVRAIADIPREEIRFLWHPYIPLGRLSLLSGDPGVGKSWITQAIAAAVSTGKALPGFIETDPAKVLLLTAEDGLGDTVRPRLESMGADLDRILAVEIATSLTGEGLAILEDVIKEYEPLLVIIDPLVAYMGAKVDMHRANEARAVMAPLARAAERYGCAILGVRHLRKGTGGRPIYAGIGSIDFTAAVRSEIMAGSDPENPAVRAIAHVKCNVAAHGASIGYTIDDGVFGWTGKSILTAERMLASADQGALSAADEAEAFLRDLLAAGPIACEEVEAEARGAGVSPSTLKRAKRNLGVKSKRHSEPGEKRGKGEWFWSLPGPQADQGDQGDQESLHGTVDPLDPLDRDQVA